MQKKFHTFLDRILSVSIWVFFISGCLYAAEPILFNDNGVWCWFQDERAIVHSGKLIIGSVADYSGTNGASRDGNIEVVQYDIASQTISSPFVLHAGLDSDDHAAPAFLVLPDDHILTVYATHGNDPYMRHRTTTNAIDATAWNPEQVYTASAGVTYSNVYRLSAENGGSGRIYDFYRGQNYNPNFVTSDDNGQTWTDGLGGVTTDGRLIAIGTGGTRPYVKYTSNSIDKIHFITTEGHPRNENNSIYYGYLYQGNLYAADGTWLHDTADGGIAPTSLEKIYQGGINNVAWTTDIALDADGYPYCAFSIQMNQTMNDMRYGYARWDGTQWYVHEIAYAGSALYSAEDDYTGLVALDPSDPDVLYISADVHPVTGDPLISSADGQRHYEIFRGTTTDTGATWTWEHITKNSTRDNIRPIIPEWDGGTILLWCRGTYTSYFDWDMDIVGLFDPQPDPSPDITDQPASVAVPLGKKATFTIQAVGQGTLAYAWYKVDGSGDILVGANSKELTLTNIQASDLGDYYCIVTNSAGSERSSSVSLSIAELTAYWPMENNFNDVTGNGYDASPVASPVFTSGVFSGQAVSFNGSNYLNCQNSADLTLSAGGTISAWIKASAASQASDWASVIAKGRYTWRLCRNGYGSGDKDGIAFHFDSPSGAYQANGDITALDDTWHHIAATYDTRSIKLYVDGTLDAEVSTSEAVNQFPDPVYIGGRADPASGADVYVDAEGGAGGNTVRAADGNVDAWWTTTRTGDGLWQRRTALGNDADYTLGAAGSDIFESTGTTGAEDVVPVVTTISGLTPGVTYKVDVVYWSASGQNWSIQAGFDLGTLLYYDALGSDGATAGTPTGKTEGGDRSEYSGLVGYTQADINGEIKVYVDDRPGGGTSYYDRCWYDGLFVSENDYSPARFWTGMIDEVRIYNFAMEAETIQLLYSRNLSCYQANPYDLAVDGQVDLDDFIFFAEGWLQNEIDFSTFAELAKTWLDCNLLPTSDCP